MSAGGSTRSPLLALGYSPNPSQSWPDAASAAAPGAAQRTPVLLAAPDELPGATRDFLAGRSVEDVRIVGGLGAVSPAVEDEMRTLVPTTRRLAGAGRIETSLAVADAAADAGMSRRVVQLVTGHTFPDALVAAPATSRLGTVLVLADGRDPDGGASLYRWRRDHADEIAEVRAIGGPGAVADDVLRKAASDAGWPL
ncbi:MAG: cell wall-binding repeat-containing protein [Nitriliruptorales bacterium]